MRVRRRQLAYGSIIGVGAFAAGWAITLLFTPQDLLPNVEPWRAALWMYLSAHFVEVSGLQLQGISGLGVEVDLVAQASELALLRALPILVTIIGGLMLADVIGGTRYYKHLIQNTASVLIGYLSAGLLAVVVSGAQPGLAMIITLGLLVGGGATVGSILVGSLVRIPVFGFITVGGIVIIGILVIVGGATVLSKVWPLVAMAGLGALTASILAYMARNAPT